MKKLKANVDIYIFVFITLVAALMALAFAVGDDSYAEKMAKNQEWCASQGGEFTRYGVGWGPDWSCTFPSGENK